MKSSTLVGPASVMAVPCPLSPPATLPGKLLLLNLYSVFLNTKSSCPERLLTTRGRCIKVDLWLGLQGRTTHSLVLNHDSIWSGEGYSPALCQPPDSSHLADWPGMQLGAMEAVPTGASLSSTPLQGGGRALLSAIWAGRTPRRVGPGPGVPLGTLPEPAPYQACALWFFGAIDLSHYLPAGTLFAPPTQPQPLKGQHGGCGLASRGRPVGAPGGPRPSDA